MSVRWTILAPLYDRMSRKSEEAGMGAMRENLLAEANGRVLEIGGGTGVNLRYYDGLDSLVVTEPEPAMLRRLHDRVRGEATQAEIVQAPAEDLPFEDESFDTVVSTLVLCGVDQERSLGEVRRVLRPGGLLLFLEHVRSDDPALARLQDRMNRLNRFLVGCECNRATLTAIEAAGFTISRVERTTMPEAPKFVRPAIVGTAVVAG
ncbi:MAG TPA: class I SAM-dependent methyltransferase [Gaiellaceae bacterium]|nr:class I SAM-dependent methyltransferase [Gaiellaceae bacterium]